MSIEVAIANYANERHARDIVYLLNCYALAPTGGGRELNTYTKAKLVEELAKLPHAFSLLCYVETAPAGLVNCFTLFSTFQCRPVVNIHDLFVDERYRRQGISQLLLEEVERIARKKDACKITLEVLEKNYAAKSSYAKFGFVGYELDPKFGRAIFLEKTLTSSKAK